MEMLRHEDPPNDLEAELLPQRGEDGNETATEQVGIKQACSAVSACGDEMQVIQAVVMALASHMGIIILGVAHMAQNAMYAPPGGNVDLGIASWTLGVGGTRHLFSTGGMQAVRSAWLDRNHHDYGQVGPNYVDLIKGFEQ